MRVGLTGGIASGKSVVGEMFAVLGAHVAQADKMSHDLMHPGEPVYQEVVKLFGKQILNEDGKVNRSRLAELAFSSKPPRIAELNAIVHPAVIAKQEAWMDEIERQHPHSIAMVEAALILEAGMKRHFDKLIVVTCNPEQRIQRWMKRTGVDCESAKKEVTRRMAVQLPDEEKIKAADYVIDNSGALDETRRQVEAVFAVMRNIIDLREFSEKSFGYGNWDAPYWFIGPEQGQSSHENENLLERVKAWRLLSSHELCDCHLFHEYIHEERWHRESPQLQSTWRPLILFLMSYLGKPADNESLRKYQRNLWGASHGETCVIELSGLPARNFKVQRDRLKFREERIRVIRQRMFEHKPKLVVMYGTTHRKSWEKIAGKQFPADGILADDYTVFLLVKHPTAPKGLTNEEWVKLGTNVSKVSKNRPQQ